MDKKIYYVSPLTWIITIPLSLLAIFCVLLFFTLIPSMLTIETPLFMIFLFVAILFLAFFVVYAALVVSDIPTTRLELSEEGLVFYGTGYRIYTSWENIAAIGWMPLSQAFPSFIQLKKPAAVSGLSFAEGIVNRQSVVEKRSWWQAAWQIKTFVQYRRYIRIPGIIFRKKDKQEGSINQYLQYYLPHLMETKQ